METEKNIAKRDYSTIHIQVSVQQDWLHGHKDSTTFTAMKNQLFETFR
jgi:hypothetical protein